MQTYRHKNGFAIVATLIMAILLTLIAVASLSLSSIEMRGTKKFEAHYEAQANARMALMLAIGRLQEHMGPDQRISANGNILSHTTCNNPHWTGVWDSWLAGDTSGDNPDGYSEHSTIVSKSDQNLNPTYQAGREDHFRSWLVSLPPAQSQEMESISTMFEDAKESPGPMDKAVKLVANGSLSDSSAPEEHVSVPLVMVTADSGNSAIRGRYAWWVGDQSQKAIIMQDAYNTGQLTDAAKVYRSQAPGATGIRRAKGLENLLDESQARKLASHRTIDLLETSSSPSPNSPRPSELNFHHLTHASFGVLADVREGGLKRDLSTILERPIDVTETGDEFMLYRFDDQGQERVPIQDLAAYYQLHHDNPSWSNSRRGGVAYDSSALPNSIQIKVPDYGDPQNREKYLREYTSMYRSPVPVRVQFLVAVGAQQITDAERQFIKNKFDAGVVNYEAELRASDTHKLMMGVMPVVSLWNPTNLPMVMEPASSQVLKFNAPPFAFRWRKYRQPENQTFTNGYFNLNYAMGGEVTTDGRSTGSKPYLIQLQFAKSAPIVFEPGEVKIFSIPFNNGSLLSSGGNFADISQSVIEPVNEWNPYGFFVTHHAARKSSPPSGDVAWFPISSTDNGYRMVFKKEDNITLEIVTEAKTDNGRNVSPNNEVHGGGLNLWMANYRHANNQTGSLHFRNYQLMSRFGGGTGNSGMAQGLLAPFNAELMQQGFPNGVAPIPFDTAADSIAGSQIIGASEAGEIQGVLSFSLMAGCEVSSSNVGGYGGGRRLASRPFLHSSALTAPLIDQTAPAAIYNFGWEWQVDRINSVEEVVQLDPGTGNAYYGGGYTAEAGTTRVVQQDLPVVAPISIASLSHAHLGGFSLANAPTTAAANDNIRLIRIVGGYNNLFQSNTNDPLRGAPNPGDFQQITATGQAGLAPHTVQAIGNSYAHPNIPADKAFTSYSRFLNHDTGARIITFADHSYLANKAIWDEFFFSSITPKDASCRLHGLTSDQSARDLAHEFFFGAGEVPNPRMKPYIAGMNEQRFAELFAQEDQYTDGLADKIAGHLLVSGSFNINSTSVDAWRILLSSMRNKTMAHLESGSAPSDHTPAGTPALPGMLTNSVPLPSSDFNSDPNNTARQWIGGRVLSDDEIDQLAEAIVRQVKSRGPFLSLSEFVNRRLDSRNTELSLKGALQAAIDDPAVSINAAFRNPTRVLDNEIDQGDFAFGEAATGPIAYGSYPYVDQADILRGFASQLTPRGDTFIVRSYGDSLAPDGRVQARAWCEAVVQRTPEYVDSADSNETKRQDLSSIANRNFGRKFVILSFRWLNPNEI